MKRIYFICLSLCLITTFAAGPAQALTKGVLYNFQGYVDDDGSEPNASLTSNGVGNLYGTTQYGGQGYGIVFELSPNGKEGWKETILHTFTGGSDGAVPTSSNLIFDSAGNLYGTTESDDIGSGGPCANAGCGVVFELSPAGGNWTETVLYTFCQQIGCTDGSNPINGLIFDTKGNLYGTTLTGGSGSGGTVFELSPSGSDWTEQVIYLTSYNSSAGLTIDATGNIFGATESAVFELSPKHKGGWKSAVIHTFTGGTKDGSGAEETPVLDATGNLYGTTTGGGIYNNGTVYKLSPPKGKWNETILYSFKGGPKDGSLPWAGIVFDAGGNMYGTTLNGGKYGEGTVFELVAPVGEGSYKERVLRSFNYTDGATPYASLVLDVAGTLYGTTQLGGKYESGVVFEVTP
ncbi:MAG TPA: choice-of-anchor tandem repeat GloVer-containing protein [Terriglobales bacterium]|jgi:uncharacterized repeat protein (TIGR03803 family)|nr:choice-of-anchor tandem repeat GloVer-containing protein [Terriglobales bacterium]